MSEKYYVGQDIFSSSNNGKYKPISRITLKVDESTAITAGDDSGYEIVAECPSATQAMVDSMLAAFKGYEYQAYSAGDANIDPAAELGDGITVGGLYSLISMIRDDGTGYPSLEAPGKAEDEDEYPGGGPMTQAFNREIAKTNAKISETEEKIRMEVNGKVSEEQANALIEVALKAITLEISNADGTTTFVLKGDGASLTSTSFEIHVKNTNIDGKLKADQIETENLQVNAANVSGSLSAAALALDGLLALTYDGTTYGYMGVNTTKGGPAISGPGGLAFLVCTDKAAKISWEDQNSLWTTEGGCYTSSALQTWSDRRLKNAISYDLSREKAFFSRLRPCSYAYNHDPERKRNWGFVAQDLVENAEQCGLDAEKLAVVTRSSDGLYSVSYDAIVALNVRETLDLIRQVGRLESRVAELESIVKEMRTNG